jgi:hypothetical protein
MVLAVTNLQTSELPTRPVPVADPGRLVATFTERPTHKWTLLVIIGMSCFLVSLANGIWSSKNGYTTFNPSILTDWFQPWIIIALLALSAVCLLLVAILGFKPRYVSIYQKGLRWRLAKQPERFIPWEEIAGIAAAFTQEHFLGIPLQRRYRARIYPTQGSPIELKENLQNLPQLITQLKTSLYPHLLPKLEKIWDGGQWVYFGSLAVHLHALSLADHLPARYFLDALTTGQDWRQVPWVQVKSVSVKAGFLVVELQNADNHRIPVSQIPNIELIFQLIHQGVAT